VLALQEEVPKLAAANDACAKKIRRVSPHDAMTLADRIIELDTLYEQERVYRNL